MRTLTVCLSAAILFVATAAVAQTAPDDTPKFTIGALLFADYTYNQSPLITDADGNRVHNSSFNVTRAYINVFGNLNHWIGFRITPDIARETGSGSSLGGSQDFRLKYAFAQFNLDDWTTKGSFVRFGVTQTPFIDYAENAYKYRFQGPIFVDREGFLTSSDAGASVRWVFPGEYGDVHAGYYNGEGFSHIETNNEKALQVRVGLHPFPHTPLLKGLRVAGFVDDDHYVAGAPRRRFVEEATFEHKLGTAGLDVLQAKDEASTSKPEVSAHGYSAWVTPRVGPWGAVPRPDPLSSQNKTRTICGVAYWFPTVSKVSSAVMLDYDSTRQTAKENDTRYGVKMLVSF